jgi:hypothetical protein
VKTSACDGFLVYLASVERQRSDSLSERINAAVSLSVAVDRDTSTAELANRPAIASTHAAIRRITT